MPSAWTARCWYRARATGRGRDRAVALLWGTDWPHVTLDGPMSDDAALADPIPQIAPSAAVQRTMLVDNPAAFFGFRGPAHAE